MNTGTISRLWLESIKHHVDGWNRDLKFAAMSQIDGDEDIVVGKIAGRTDDLYFGLQ